MPFEPSRYHCLPSSSCVRPHSRAHRAARGLLDDAARRPARAERVEVRVQPVVERPGHGALFLLDVVDAAVAGAEQLLLVCDAVAVRVGVLPDFLRVRFLRQDRVGSVRHHESRKHEMVDEDACACRRCRRCSCRSSSEIRPTGSSSPFASLSGHVARILEHEHPAVAVEHDGGRILNVRIGQHELEAIAGLQDEVLQLVCWSIRQHRWLLRPVDSGIHRGVFRRSAAAATTAATLVRTTLTLGWSRRLVPGIGWRLRDQREIRRSRRTHEHRNQPENSFHKWRLLYSRTPERKVRDAAGIRRRLAAIG